MHSNATVKLNFDRYHDKVRACWIGKNIGGTMGAPYEGLQEALNVTGFSTASGAPLPNDDLDLQLVWLLAVEKIGIRAVNSMTLGEFWLSYIPPHWNEYGIGKLNMQRGLLPQCSLPPSQSTICAVASRSVLPAFPRIAAWQTVSAL